jgi:outer membrane immunogenic protein
MFVAGIEGDFTFSGASDKVNGFSVDNNWNSTLRARAGIAIDRFLMYGTGGLAVGNISVDVPGGKTDTGTHAGWTVGGGAEFAWRPNWTVKAEYLFLRFDGDTYSGTANYLPPNPSQSYRFSASPAEFNVVRVGLNYKFGRSYEAPLSEAPLK